MAVPIAGGAIIEVASQRVTRLVQRAIREVERIAAARASLWFLCAAHRGC